MCLGTVVVSRTASTGAVEVKDVTAISFEPGAVRVSTLFGDEQLFLGVSIQRIDMQKGVIVTLIEENTP
ncbi:MAG TPA: CooT family nickel-binding protein [Rhodopseudomonas sp.]|uniref:CooT family nickel-binding protein n=1 Tax=Rhodopseudomonas sp. TaxID=1078 RepID=UPI002EDB62A7